MKFTKRAVSKNGAGGDSYLKLTDGDSVTAVPRGEVFEFWQVWPKGGEKQVFDKPTPGASSRFKINLVVHEKGRFIAKVWEFPVAVYNQLADVSSVYDLTTTKIKITRNGSGTNTTYMILPLVNEKLAPKAMKEIEAVELHILGHQAQAEPPPVKNYAPGADDEDDIGF